MRAGGRAVAVASCAVGARDTCLASAPCHQHKTRHERALLSSVCATVRALPFLGPNSQLTSQPDHESFSLPLNYYNCHLPLCMRERDPSNSSLPVPLLPLIRPARPMASSARRLLQTNSGQYPTLPAAEPPGPLAVDSDVVVILAALLCALVCVVGLAAVARCTRSRRGAAPPSAAAAAKGLRKKALSALPRLAYEDAVAAAAAARGGSAAAAEDKILAECAICLSEFAPREEIRVLPQCGHGFHVACIDTWLGAHSSCPSCRRVLVVDETNNKRPPQQPKRCRECEAAMEEAASSSSGSGSGSGSAADGTAGP